MGRGVLALPLYYVERFLFWYDVINEVLDGGVLVHQFGPYPPHHRRLGLVETRDIFRLAEPGSRACTLTLTGRRATYFLNISRCISFPDLLRQNVSYPVLVTYVAPHAEAWVRVYI